MLWSTELRARGGRHHTQSIGRIGAGELRRPARRSEKLRRPVRLRQTPPVPRQHFPTSRRRRRLGIARASLLGTVAAAGIVLAMPATTPRGDVLDLVTDRVGPATAIGLEPTPATAREETAPAAPAVAAPAGPFTDPRRSYLVGPVEQAVIVAPKGPPPVAGLTGYQWPIAHPRITLPFGPTPWGTFVVDGQRFHDGIDIATFCGDRVLAAHDGTVIAAGRHFDTLMGWVGHLDRYFARLDAATCGGSCRWWWSSTTATAIAASTRTSAR